MSDQRKPPLRSGTTLVRMTLWVMVPLIILMVVVVLVSQTVHHTDMQRLVGDRNLRVLQAASVSIETELTQLTSLLSEFRKPDLNEPMAAQKTPYANFPLGVYSFKCPENDINVLAQPLDIWQVNQQDLPVSQICQKRATNPLRAAQFISGKIQTKQVLWIATDTTQQTGLVAGLDLQQMLNRLLAIPLGQDHLAIMVYDSDHTLLYVTGERPAGEHTLYHEGILSGLHGTSGVLLPGGGHQAHIISYTPVTEMDWILVMDEAWDDISNPSLNISQSIPLFLIPVVILLFIMLFLGYRQIVKPLNQLQNKASLLRQGNEAALAEDVGGMQEIRSLQAVLRETSAELIQSRKNLAGYAGGLTDAIEAEKKELARELHDDSLQDLIALKQQISSNSKLNADELNRNLKAVIQKLRRVIKGLRPPYLDDLGLITALQVLAQEKSSPGIEISVTQVGEEIRFSSTIELAVYRIAQEAMTNSLKHAKAKHLLISFLFSVDSLILRIEDDGIGFEVPERLDKLATENRYGLLGMQERADQAGIVLSVQSSPGSGTRIEVSNIHKVGLE